MICCSPLFVYKKGQAISLMHTHRHTFPTAEFKTRCLKNLNTMVRFFILSLDQNHLGSFACYPTTASQLGISCPILSDVVVLKLFLLAFHSDGGAAHKRA
jgi:hypothetical protein